MYKKRKRNNIKNYLIGGLSVALVGTIGTLAYEHSNKDNCNIPGRHSHLYVNSRNYSIYLDSEEAKVGGFKKTNSFRFIFNNENEDEFISRLMSEGMVLIADNLDLLHYLEQTNGWENIVAYDASGEPICATAGFVGYKYDYENDIFVGSPYVSSLENIMEEYPYFKMDKPFDIIDSKNLSDGFEAGTFEDDDSQTFFDNPFEGNDGTQDSEDSFDDSEDIPDYFYGDDDETWDDFPIEGFQLVKNEKVKTKTKLMRNC